jgi:hypothetical protein
MIRVEISEDAQADLNDQSKRRCPLHPAALRV